MSNPIDWLAITIKFRGKCIECNKEIRAGQQALWSKSTKAIKHLDCLHRSSDEITSSKDGEEPPTHKQKKQSIAPEQKRFPQAKLPKKCFICGRDKTGGNEYDSDDYPIYREVESQSYICQSCLQREDAFQAYQHAFLQKINRYLK